MNNHLPNTSVKLARITEKTNTLMDIKDEEFHYFDIHAQS